MKISVTVKRTNTKNQARHILLRSRRTKQDRVERGVVAIGDFLLAEARALCPKDTHLLANSGNVRKFNKGIETVVTVGFGPLDHGKKTAWSAKLGKNVDRDPSEYAITVHFDGSMRHDDGQYAYYLQGPRDSMQDDMRRIFWAEMSK